jgi:alpha-L-fucosidase
MVIYTLAGQFAHEPYGEKYKSGQWILSNLIDIVAKGGNFMVSIGPEGDGNFHPEAVKKLEYAGDWLKVNGEAIYKTRPWEHWKEGQNVRFTRSKDGKYVYAICSGWPGTEFASRLIRPGEDSQIIMLGVDEPLKWRSDPDRGIVIDLPETLQVQANRRCRQSYVFRIEQPGAGP